MTSPSSPPGSLASRRGLNPGAMPVGAWAFRLRVATLNTWKGDGEYDRRLPAMASALASVDADIVLLQEVFRAQDAQGGDVDTAAYLAEHLGMDCVSQAARRKTRLFRGYEVDSGSGLAILSKTPVIPCAVHGLPIDPRDGERIAQVADVILPEARVRVVNLHLTHLEDADDLRRRQIDVALTALPRDRLVIIGGDFNAVPSDAAVRAVGSRFNERAVTTAGRVGCTTPGGRAIDHLFVAGMPGAAPPMLERAGLFGDGADPDQSVAPSDHYGVLAEVLVPLSGSVAPGNHRY